MIVSQLVACAAGLTSSIQSSVQTDLQKSIVNLSEIDGGSSDHVNEAIRMIHQVAQEDQDRSRAENIESSPIWYTVSELLDEALHSVIDSGPARWKDTERALHAVVRITQDLQSF